MPTPRFSIVLIAYNQQQYVEAAVRSVLTSESRDLEIVCVDDGSDDETFSILTRLADGDPRVRPVRIEHSGRPASVRNAGLDLVRGDYVCFLDGDDLDDSRRFLLLGDALDRCAQPPDVLFHDYVDFTDGTPPECGVARLRSSDVGDALRGLATSCDRLHDGTSCFGLDGDSLGRFLMAREFVVVTSTICIRADVLRARALRFPTDRVVGEDNVVWMKCVVGGRVTYVDAPLSYWRKYPDSLTARRSHAKQSELVRSMLELAAMATPLLSPDERREVGRRILQEKLDMAYMLEEEGRPWHATRTYLTIAREEQSPLSLMRAVKALVWPPHTAPSRPRTRKANRGET